MLTRCLCDNTTAAGHREASQVRAVLSYKQDLRFTVLVLSKNTSLTFYTHPVLGGCQNNSTIGTSPDPLSSREGLACETRSGRPQASEAADKGKHAYPDCELK